MTALCQSLNGPQPDPVGFKLADGRGVCRARVHLPLREDKGQWKWVKDVQHFESLPARSPGLLFADVAL